VTLSGNINHTGPSGLAIQNNTGGSVTFSGASKVLNTGSNTAVSITGNSAGFGVSFTGGGLDIDTTSGTGLNLSGSGDLTISGSGNSITVVNGAALAISAGAGAINVNPVLTSTGASQLVSIQGRTGGTVTVAGNLATTNASGTSLGVLVQNNTGGTITFSGASKALTTGANAAVRLLTNTGAAVDFTGGGLVINTTSGAGYTATGGGTVTVQGTGNTITTTTGTAIDIQNTTIGAAGVNFQSVSSNGAANGILLNNTGASGGLTVTGTGTAGSGGTIQNSTGDGVRLTTTRDVNLNYMNIQNGQDNGIRGTGITNFTLNRSNVINNGNSTTDDGVRLGEPSGSVVGVTGTVTITNSSITGNAHNNVHIRNTSGVIDTLVVTNSTFNDLNDTFGANAFLLEASGTSSITKAFLTNNTFSNNSPQRALEVQAHDTATISDFVVSGNTFLNNGIHASFTQDTASNLEFYFVNNGTPAAPMTGSILQAVNVFSSSNSTGGTISGTISGNYVGNNSVAGSGSTTGGGIRVLVQGLTAATLLIDGNSIFETPQGRGIDAQFLGTTTAGQTVPVSDITITNNIIDHTHLGFSSGANFPLAGIFLAADNQGSAAFVRADVRGNTVPTAASAGVGSYDYPTFDGNAAYLVLEELGGGTLQLVDTAPASPNAASQLASTNTGSTSANAGVSLIAGPINKPGPVPTP
jgi:hypothetical protein